MEFSPQKSSPNAFGIDVTTPQQNDIRQNDVRGTSKMTAHKCRDSWFQTVKVKVRVLRNLENTSAQNHTKYCVIPQLHRYSVIMKRDLQGYPTVFEKRIPKKSQK